MDQELFSYLDARFREIQDFREETLNRFDRLEARLQRAEDAIRENQEAIRHTGITVEALRDEIHLVADGVAAVDQKLDKLKSQIQASTEQLDRRVTRLEQRAKLH